MRTNDVRSMCLVVSATISLLLTGCGGNGTDASLWAKVEIDGITTTGPFLVIQGPGYDIERIPGFDDTGKPNDMPGNAVAQDLIFEADGDAAIEYQSYFDAFRIAPKIVGLRDGGIMVPSPDGTEAFRWDFLDFAPSGRYTAGDDGRIRFKLTCSQPTNTIAVWQFGGEDPFGSAGSFTPGTDSKVDIVGITTSFYPSVAVDSQNLTMAMDFDIAEGNGVFGWVKDIVEGKGQRRTVILTRLDSGMSQGLCTTYTNCFPIKYEQYSGYDLVTRIKARVVLAYCASADN